MKYILKILFKWWKCGIYQGTYPALNSLTFNICTIIDSYGKGESGWFVGSEPLSRHIAALRITLGTLYKKDVQLVAPSLILNTMSVTAFLIINTRYSRIRDFPENPSLKINYASTLALHSNTI